jgi:hypothetical protein
MLGESDEFRRLRHAVDSAECEGRGGGRARASETSGGRSHVRDAAGDPSERVETETFFSKFFVQTA